MSGHSKWHNIQKTKGAADAKRSATFTKIAKEIIVAVKQGGSGDPANNSRLATVVAKAKAANMPNDNIKRTIDKALGSGNTDNYESVTYEGYGPCGVAVIVEALTDNRQRTAPEIRHYFDKYGKGMGAQGCVSWSFDRKGVIVIDNEDGELDEDTVMMDALDAGAEDFSPRRPRVRDHHRSRQLQRRGEGSGGQGLYLRKRRDRNGASELRHHDQRGRRQEHEQAHRHAGG